MSLKDQNEREGLRMNNAVAIIHLCFVFFCSAGKKKQTKFMSEFEIKHQPLSNE